jgi:hypothetical protein
MKTIYYIFTPLLIICVLFIILVAPAKAQSIDTQSQIQLLLKQLVILQEQLRLLIAHTSYTQPVTNQGEIKTQGPVTESWEKRFVSSPTQIPKNALRAFYFDTKSPKTTIFEEVVTGADTHYLPDNQNLSNIAPDGFGGYWIGNYVFTKEQMYTIHISQGSSESRIRIDGVVVFEGTESKSFDYNFTRGTHKVEIEQVNKNWTGSGSTIFLLPWAKSYTIAELSTALEPQWKNKSAQVWLASPYDIGGADRTVTVSLKQTSVPTTLVLSSYIATTWAYPTNSQANIKAIVLSSYDKGSSIKNVPPNIPVYVLREWIENVDGNHLVTICPITEDYCSRDNDVRPAAQKVASFFGGEKPSGIGAMADSRVLLVPFVTLDESVYQKLDAAVIANDKARSDYQKSNQLKNVFQSY